MDGEGYLLRRMWYGILQIRVIVRVDIYDEMTRFLFVSNTLDFIDTHNLSYEHSFGLTASSEAAVSFCAIRCSRLFQRITTIARSRDCVWVIQRTFSCYN